MKGTTHITPAGDIKFAAIARPIKNSRTAEDEFVIRLQIDGTTAAGMTFKKTIHQINNKKVVTTRLDADGNDTLNLPAGHFLVTFNSKRAPQVFNEAGVEIKDREIPFFNSKTDQGQAVVEYLVGPENKVNPGNPPSNRI